MGASVMKKSKVLFFFKIFILKIKHWPLRYQVFFTISKGLLFNQIRKTFLEGESPILNCIYIDLLSYLIYMDF